jgi:hypothetical protein
MRVKKMKNQQMSKYMLFALLFLVLVGVINAEITPITTHITLGISNNTINLITESGQYNYVCGNSITNGIDITFFRNATCATDLILQQDQQIIRTLSEGINDSTKYYEKYLDCYGNLKVLQSSANTTDYLVKYTQCFEEWNSCKSEKSSLITSTQSAQSGLSTCQIEKKTSEDGKTVWGIGGVIIGLAIYYFFIDKGRHKPAVSVAEQQLPKSR